MKDETEIEKCNGRSKYFIANGEIDTNAEREVNNKGSEYFIVHKG